tara:strand:- start:776 stop:1147 length:372 start_codon:yes stop_codon:yes gene_type:complete
MSYLNNRPKTILCDIDGTLVKHTSPLETTKPGFKMELLPGTLKKLAEWDIKGYNIILISGRREGARKETEKQLNEVGIIYDKLILGVGGGIRVLLNDKKPDGTTETALAYNLTRNKGIKNITI